MADLYDSARSLCPVARALLDSSPTGVALVDGPELVFRFANRAFLALLAGREVIGRPFAEVWPEPAAVLPHLQLARAGHPCPEVAVQLPAGPAAGAAPRVAHLTLSLEPIEAGGGAPAAVAIHALDRTAEAVVQVREQELAEERDRALRAALVARATQAARQVAEGAAAEARRRAAELDTVFDSIADGLILYDPSGDVARMNAAAIRLLGYEPPERRLHLSDRVARLAMSDARGAPIPHEDTPMARALRGEVVRGMEMRFARRDGRVRPFWAQASAAPILGPEGEVTGAVLTLADITPLRELQEQREDLLRAISHDLRTPLTVISAQAQLLARRPDGREGVLRRAERINTSADRMAAMIEDLVELVRLEAGKLRLAPQPVALRPFALELRDRLRGAVAVERLRIEVPADVPRALADPARLERILVNLITNALKYSPPEARATIAAAADPERPDHLRITVRDEGPGIAPEELPRLFERFYRSPTSLPAEGLGLGLYITRLLAEAHGGAITAESRPGRGSAFHVSLPRAPE